MRQNIIKDKTFRFSLEIIVLYKKLIEDKEYVLSKQLLRSATSIGANVVEAEAAQSKADFITKMSIASKEARETRYWLQLLQESTLTNADMRSPVEEIEDIINILAAIVKTAQENNRNDK